MSTNQAEPVLERDPILTLPQAAEYLGLNRRTVERYVADGDIRAGRVGNGPKARIRIRRSECDRFLFGPENES